MTEWRRFHPAAVAFEVLGALRDAALPVGILIAGGLLQGGLDAHGLARTLGFGILGAAVALVLGLVRWGSTEWRLSATDIRRRSGVLRREERSVPLARIQALDGVRGPLQRLFGVVTLHVQTAGGAKDGEIVLTALRPDEALALHELVGGHVPLDRTGPLRRLRGRELVLGALTSGQTGLVVAAAAAAAQVGQDLLDPQDTRRDLDVLERLAPDTVLGWLALGGGVVAAVWAIAIAGSLVAFSGFTLMRDGERLRIRRGLFSVRESSVPVRRVQGIRIVEGLLRQPLGLCTLRVETLGAGDEPAANTTAFPLLRRREVEALLREFLPEHATDVTTVERPPRRALRRYVLPPAAVVLVPAVVVAAVVDAVGWWPPLLALPAAVLGTLRWSGAGWRLDADGHAVLRHRRLARDTLVFPIRRTQTASVDQSLLQRRAGLADIELDIGPSAGTVRHLEAATAWRLWQASRRARASPPG